MSPQKDHEIWDCSLRCLLEGGGLSLLPADRGVLEGYLLVAQMADRNLKPNSGQLIRECFSCSRSHVVVVAFPHRTGEVYSGLDGDGDLWTSDPGATKSHRTIVDDLLRFHDLELRQHVTQLFIHAIRWNARAFVCASSMEFGCVNMGPWSFIVKRFAPLWEVDLGHCQSKPKF